MWRIWNFNSDIESAAVNAWPSLATVGIGLILSAIMIFVAPQLVAYLIATLLLWAGIAVVAIAWQARKQQQQRWSTRSEFWEIL